VYLISFLDCPHLTRLCVNENRHKVGKRISADAARYSVRASRSLVPQAVMSESVQPQQHSHEGSRADYITSLALARSHAESHGHPFLSHSHPFRHHDRDNTTPPSRHMPKRLQPSAIPDLRFEPTYLTKLGVTDSGWQSIVWITIRDHAISPLLQGVIWCVALKALTVLFIQLTCQPVQGYRVRFITTITTIIAVPYVVAKSVRRFAASERRQRRRLAPPMGPLNIFTREVGGLVRDTMMEVKLRAKSSKVDYIWTTSVYSCAAERRW